MSRSKKAAPPARRKLPDTRKAITHKFNVAGHKGYITVGMYEDGKPGELFITTAEGDPTIGGLLDCFAMSASIALQHGVPVKTLVEQFVHRRFAPSGFTRNPDIPNAASVIDYVFRWVGIRFVPGFKKDEPAIPAEPLCQA